jgi:hypothetical protein
MLGEEVDSGMLSDSFGTLPPWGDNGAFAEPAEIALGSTSEKEMK